MIKIFLINFLSYTPCKIQRFRSTKWTWFKRAIYELNTFFINFVSLYTLLDSAVSAQQNEADLKSVIATLQFFLLTSLLKQPC